MTPDSKDRPWILGYSASHNGAVCLLHGTRIVVAVQEERLTGVKKQRLKRLDESLALRYCLLSAGITIQDLDCIVGCYFSGESMAGSSIVPQGWRGRFLSIPHHLGHAAGAFAQSGFDESAILIVDGQGGAAGMLPEDEQRAGIQSEVPGSDKAFEIMSIYEAAANPTVAHRTLEKHFGDWVPNMGRLRPDQPMQCFGSLGGMYAACAHQIFGDANDAGKVMGLAALGKPSIPVEEFFEIRDGRFIFNDRVCTRYLSTERWPRNQQQLADLACSVQQALEVGMLYLVERTATLSPSRNLCLAGGVALNCVANERIVNECGYQSVFIMPAAEDSGPAIGAAYYGLWNLGHRHDIHEYRHDSLGHCYAAGAIDQAVQATPFVRAHSEATPEAIAERLVDGQILGWFQGGSELGPRALGQRSIVADPRPHDAKDRLNLRVKHREAFRPFAPAVLEEDVGEWFELPRQPTSPTMLRAFRFRADRAGQVPAVVHHDGTGRLQTVSREANPALHALITAFKSLTGVPVVVNTSFNVMGEPIVETPEDALWCLLYTELDGVAFGHCLVTRDQALESILDLVPIITAGALEVETTLQGQVNPGELGNGPMRLKANTPWGKRWVPLGPVLRPVLDLIDGTRSGHRILERLGADPDLGEVSPFWLMTVLRQLRRASVLTLKRP